MNAGFQPVAIRDRIQALDVVRGFALLGIALMNVEFFNRPIGELDMGMPAGTSGIDYWAGWFVHVFVDGHVVEEGGVELADRLEIEGYDRFVRSAAKVDA